MVCGLVWLQEQIPKWHMFKEIKLHARNMITNLVSIVNTIGGSIWTFDEHKIPYFDDE